MTSFETFQEILDSTGVSAPAENLEVFRDLVDAQADVIIDSWLASKHDSNDSVK